MCHKIGLPPISTIGFGRTEVSSLIRVPSPPARITAFIDLILHYKSAFGSCIRMALTLSITVSCNIAIVLTQCWQWLSLSQTDPRSVPYPRSGASSFLCPDSTEAPPANRIKSPTEGADHTRTDLIIDHPIDAYSQGKSRNNKSVTIFQSRIGYLSNTTVWRQPQLDAACFLAEQAPLVANIAEDSVLNELMV
jgi:hypothetical protein